MTESSSVALANVKEPIEDVVVVFGVEYDLVCAILYLLPNLISSPEKVSIRYAKLQQSRGHGYRTLVQNPFFREAWCSASIAKAEAWRRQGRLLRLHPKPTVRAQISTTSYTRHVWESTK